MPYKSKLLVLILILALSITTGGCQEIEGNNEQNNDKLLIYTSIYPLYYFTNEIVGEKAKVINLIPTGAEAHDFEPTVQDIMNVSKADVFVYNGSGFETWLEKMIEAVNNPDLNFVNTTKQVGEQLPENLDPHVWLDPNLAKLQAEAIKNTLVAIDKENSQLYEENYKQLAANFEGLDTKISEVVKHSERRDFVVSHAAFGYLADRYVLDQIAITGLNHEEPSPKQLQEMITYLEDHEVEYILFESMGPRKVADVVRTEVGAKALTLHSLEGLTEEELSQGKDYFSIMEENLEVLKLALGYKR